MVTSKRVHLPHLEAATRFTPVFMNEEDLEDLSTFFGLDGETCRQRLQSYSMREMADRWNAIRPQTPEQITSFYQNADLYIWELLQWHASPARAPYWEALAYLAEHFSPDAGFRRVLDLGAGVGTDGLFLAGAGYDVTLMDIDGPAFRFAQHRFTRRGLSGRFQESRWPLPPLGGPYDVIVCFDVFEHLPDPLEAARRLVRALRPGGLLVQRAAFSDEGLHPCHLHANISHFSGLRWHIWMAGLGLRAVTGFIYRRCPGATRVVQKTRCLFWRLTGIWLTRA